MRVSALLTTAAAFVLSVSTASGNIFEAAAEDPVEPAVVVTATFPEANPFGHVVNGEKNSLLLNVENKSGHNVTLVNVAGSLTTTKFGIILPEGVKLEVPYTFYSEFKPGDLRLNVWLEHSTDDETYRVSAYDSVVTIVEPEISILDFKLITTYLMVAAILGGLTYLAYLNFIPQPKKSHSKKVSPSTAPSATSTAAATSAGGYQEEWIPEHHLKKSKKSSGAAASGDELSGGELSGEGRKRKGKK
ncbi:hypothetical protein C0995_008178 [Termitomyces sp. Mi166|nr:hypothetical protein C0995_008178 [Termitomyces sp. Mi166\